MSAAQQPKAWLLMAAGDDRGFGGNSGYDDRSDVYYTWDSTVNNSGAIQAGDVVALWDKRQLLGLSVVESITSDVVTKQLFRCAQCGRSKIKARKTMLPRYLCQACGHGFDDPRVEEKAVTQYRSLHDAAWTDLSGLIGADELRSLCESPKSQLSMRTLDWAAFKAAVEGRGERRAIARVENRSFDAIYPDGFASQVEFDTASSEAAHGDLAALGQTPHHPARLRKISQGHSRALVRVRRGQAGFRADLLKAQGGLCAFTGRAPDRVLDAGHLYSYAKLGEHHEHGGLLLRRDIHRLFDDGLLAVDPRTLRIDVTEALSSYPLYTQLDGRTLQLTLRGKQAEWLDQHWQEHRG